jgi:phosphopantetheinyl transferase (holo-ACP synthase)
MIGNDIVDLALAREKSDWKRKGFLNKIFTPREQNLILNDSNPDVMVWNLWSRKEAAYKVFNRKTGISGYFPLRLQCQFENANSGVVTIDNTVIYTQTQITQSFVYTVAVEDVGLFGEIKNLENRIGVLKENQVPYRLNSVSKRKFPVSITHHGRYEQIITLF